MIQRLEEQGIRNGQVLQVIANTPRHWFLDEDVGPELQRLHAADEFPGEGVGLASVKRIVERHGGTITGEGVPGQGARFRFTLPDEPA